MGMLVDGRWVAEADRFIKDGAFVRAASAFDRDLPPRVIAEISSATGRYSLVASMSCPWSHRVLLMRVLKGLDKRLPLQVAGGPRVEGYAVDGSGLTTAPSGPRLAHIHQLYSLSDPGYTGRATVPILWDKAENRIISNDSARLMRGLDAADGPQGFTLVPEVLRHDVEDFNKTIHAGLANAVYRAGLAQRQDLYDVSVAEIFETLARLEDRLARQRYLFGQVVTETDWRLFTTLVRFDAVYATHFRCTRRRLIDHPNLWDYARDLYCWRGVAETVDFEAILEGYYVNDGDHNPHGIVAEMPEAEWPAPHGRDRLGAAQVWSRRRGPMEVDPATHSERGH